VEKVVKVMPVDYRRVLEEQKKAAEAKKLAEEEIVHR
jgi:glutamate synthase (ferredoxin)